MGIFNDAHVAMFVADYVGVDPNGKVNAIGAGFAITGINPETNLTAPMYLAVLIDVPSKYVGQEFAAGVELWDHSTGGVVKVPGPSGQPDALRLQQILKVNPANVGAIYLPESMFTRLQLNIAFPTGLPLAAGHPYQWRVEIEGNHNKYWTTDFYVAGQRPQPVFGGGTGPTDIPSI